MVTMIGKFSSEVIAGIISIVLLILSGAGWLVKHRFTRVENERNQREEQDLLEAQRAQERAEREFQREQQRVPYIRLLAVELQANWSVLDQAVGFEGSPAVADLTSQYFRDRGLLLQICFLANNGVRWSPRTTVSRH